MSEKSERQQAILDILAGYGEEEGCDIVEESTGNRMRIACNEPNGTRYDNPAHWCLNCKLAYLAGAKIADEEVSSLLESALKAVAIPMEIGEQGRWWSVEVVPNFGPKVAKALCLLGLWEPYPHPEQCEFLNYYRPIKQPEDA